MKPCLKPGHCKHKPFWSARNYAFSHCTNCDLIVRSPLPTQSELDAIYDVHYSLDNIDKSSTNQLSDNVSMSEYANYLLDRKIIRPGEKLLDFGTGNGAFPMLLSKNSIRASGYDPCFNNETGSVSVPFIRTLEEAFQDSYDAITLIEVVEHLYDPLQTLKQIHARLTPGGRVIMTTPNFRGLRARLEGAKWKEAIKTFHLCFFSRKSLGLLLRESGFKKISVIRFPPKKSTLAKAVYTKLLYALGLGGTLMVIAWK